MGDSMECKVTFDKEKERVRLQFDGLELVMTAEQLEAFVGTLLVVRMQMSPPVTTDPRGDKTVIADVHFWSQPDPVRGGCIIAARHPGAGWMYLHMAKETATRMFPHLRDAPHPGPMTKN